VVNYRGGGTPIQCFYDKTSGKMFMNTQGQSAVAWLIAGAAATSAAGGSEFQQYFNGKQQWVNSAGVTSTSQYIGTYATGLTAASFGTVEWAIADGSNGTASVFITLSGDSNLDKTVDVIDLGFLATNYGTSGKAWQTGDYNGDGVVDVVDLGLLATNYGAGVSAADLVPEPATMALIGLGMALVVRRRK
jgi:hypothetical protein